MAPSGQNDAARHVAHDRVAALLYVPAGHDVHTPLLAAHVVGLPVHDASHVLQELAPAREKVPAAHATGAVDPSAQADPAGHCVHLLLLL